MVECWVGVIVVIKFCVENFIFVIVEIYFGFYLLNGFKCE